MNVMPAPATWELGTDATFWITVIVAILAGLGTGATVLSALTSWVAWKRERNSRSESAPESLDDKIKSLGDLAERLRLMAAEVTTEAEAQIGAAEKAAKEARENEKLASLTREQAEAVSEIFAAQGRTSIRESKRLGWVSLLISVVVSNAVTVGVTVWLTVIMK